MVRKVQYYNEITLLKAIATLLITWYHFKWTVPDSYGPLFIGGAFGNSLFFFCSGYLLKFTEEKYFGQWIIKKYLRLMPAIWITYLLFTCCLLFREVGFVLPSRIEWFYPARYWFICNIIIYFFICWLIRPIMMKCSKDRQNLYLKILMIFIAVVQVIWYLILCNHCVVNIDEGYMKSWYFFIFFLWGYYAKVNDEKIKETKLSYLYVIISVILFFIYKKSAEHYFILAYLQVIFIPLLLAFVVYAFRVVATHVINLELSNNVKQIIIFLSNITLEMYIVQVFFIEWIMPKVSFPLNILVSLIVIFFAAYFVHVCSSYIASKLKLIL